MQASDYLRITDFSANSNGIIDVIRTRFQPWCNTAGAVTAANNLIAAITAERNNVHALLVDGVTEVAPTISAAAADDGGKMRYVTIECIRALLANSEFGVSLVTDQSITWVNTLNNTNKPNSVEQREIRPFTDFVNNTTPLITTNVLRTTAYNLHATTIARVFTLWDTVDTLA